MISAIVMVGMLASCQGPEFNAMPNPEVQNAVALRIATGIPAGASVPQGGEYGDGLEPGQHHENDVYSLTLYSYSGSINADENTPVRLVAYLNDLNLTSADARVERGEYIYDVRVDDRFLGGYIFSPADKFVVITNAPLIHAETLGELRNAYITQPVQRAAAGQPMRDYTRFAMSNESESSYIHGIGSKDNPNLIVVRIERVTARVDLVTNGSTVSAARQALCYPATDGAQDKHVADVYVSHVRVFNALQEPTYLIKRLAATESDRPLYLADESKPADRLVIEPRTWQKGTTAPATIATWYGDSHLAQAQAQGDSWFRQADRVHTAAASSSNDGFGTATSVDQWGYSYYVVDYVNENTMRETETSSLVTTGLMLRAVYQPLAVYGSLDENDEPVLDADYAYGQTFWRYRPIGVEYDETQALYFSSETVAEAYRDAHTETLSELTEYTEARCYYPVYLRHDNTNRTEAIHCMEFAIVRNNIYRLKVGFTGPGYPTLDRIIEIDPEGIRPYIFVRNWYKILHPEIEL